MNKNEEFENPEKPSPKPDKAYKNLSFLNSSAARSIRVLCELTEPAVRLDDEGVRNTIVFFGSARNPAPERAEQLLEEMEAHESGPPLSEESARQLKARRKQIERAVKYYRFARELAAELTRWSNAQEDADKKFFICSGGGPGIMEAANRGARDAGGRSVALGISLPFEQKLNPYCDEPLSFDFHYFFLRKYWFLYHAKALVVFPGGFGTFDELFEMLTLIQTRKTTKFIQILLIGREFWENTVNFSNLVEWGVISPEDLGLFRIIDSIKEARDLLIHPFDSGRVAPGGDPGIMPE
ncbi:MAG: LOG family protein [Puniceicoccaceae bacterium]